LAGDQHAISKNASIILTFTYLLRFDTPEVGE
jgi:hypothetical protein